MLKNCPIVFSYSLIIRSGIRCQTAAMRRSAYLCCGQAHALHFAHPAPLKIIVCLIPEVKKAILLIYRIVLKTGTKNPDASCRPCRDLHPGIFFIKPGSPWRSCRLRLACHTFPLAHLCLTDGTGRYLEKACQTFRFLRRDSGPPGHAEINNSLLSPQSSSGDDCIPGTPSELPCRQRYDRSFCTPRW